MPELPDVEVFREVFTRHALRRRIESVSAPRDRVLRVSPGTLRSALRGHEMASTHRHGKHLFVEIAEPRGRWLRLHFGMTGNAQWLPKERDPPDHVKLRCDFAAGGSVVYCNVRKLGQVDLVTSPEAFVEERGLGPDPLGSDFGARELGDVLRDRRGSLKATLMNQELIAGLGNIYTDEVLFQARLSPTRRPADLGRSEIERLARNLDRVLERAIEAEVDVDRMPRTWLLPHRRDGADCPRCDGTIRKSTLSGRSTYACDRHQA